MMRTSPSPGVVERIDQLPRRTRRLIAIAALSGLPAMYVWSSFWLGTSVPSLIWGPVSFVLVGATAIGAVVLYRFVRDRANLGNPALDERQRDLRDQAWVMSYGVLAVAVVGVIAIGAIVVLGLGRTLTVDGNLMTAAAISVGTLLPLLPVAALAWLEPDLPEDA